MARVLTIRACTCFQPGSRDAAKADSPVGLAREQMVRLIRDAGKVPVERNALYEVVKVYDN